MSYIGKNIKKIRTVKKLSQAAFAQLFNLARPSVGAYEEGRSEPKMETVVQMARHFGLSIDLLLTKELTVNELYGFDIFKKGLRKEESLIEVAAGAAPAFPDTYFVRADQMLAYIVHHHDPRFLEGMPTVRFPGLAKGATRAFEHTGSDMLYQQHGLHHGDVLLCIAVTQPASGALQAGQVYVVVLQGKVLVRRLAGTSGKQKLRLKPDNPDHELVEVALKDVLEMWEVQGVYSTTLRPPLMLEERLALLETTVRQLSQRLKKVEG